jgi:hypothetical protein
MPKKTYPKGHWMGLGIGIGIPIGTFMFFLVDIMSGDFGNMFFLGPGVGVAIGVSIGAALEEKYKDRIRPLTPKEEKRKKRMVNIGLLILVAGALLGMLAFMA